MLDDGKFMSSIEFVNFMARSGLRTWTWMTRCRSTNEAKFIPMQPNVVGLVAGRGGENLKRLKQLPDVDSIEVYTNDADGQFEGRIHKQAGAHDRNCNGSQSWEIARVSCSVQCFVSCRDVHTVCMEAWKHFLSSSLPLFRCSRRFGGHCNSRGISTSREGSAENRTSTLGIAFKAFFDIFFGAMESF